MSDGIDLTSDNIINHVAEHLPNCRVILSTTLSEFRGDNRRPKAHFRIVVEYTRADGNGEPRVHGFDKRATRSDLAKLGPDWRKAFDEFIEGVSCCLSKVDSLWWVPRRDKLSYIVRAKKTAYSFFFFT